MRINLFFPQYFSELIWRISKNYKCFLKIPGKQSTESNTLSYWSLFSCSEIPVSYNIIFRLIMSHTEMKLAFFYYNDVPGRLALMVRNLLISCIVIPCGSHSAYLPSLYSMKCLNEDSLTFIWFCPSFESGCQSCHLFPHAQDSGGDSTGTWPGCLEEPGAAFKSR